MIPTKSNGTSWFCDALRKLFVLAAGFVAALASAVSSAQFNFEDVTGQTNIDFEHRDGSSGEHYLIEAVASGVATIDYDRDGDMDVYFLNGAALKGTEYAEPPVNRLYRNEGGFNFTDVTEQAGLGDAGFGLGVVVGDINNDGFPDVYLSNYGANVLYINDGMGRFIKHLDSALSCGSKVGAGVSLIDIENDGDLDIYAASYIQFDCETHPTSEFHGKIVYGGPVLFEAEPDDLLRNNGDGTFTNISEAAGIADVAEWGMGTIALDIENDGDTDIFVANDSTLNFLWK